MPPIPRPLLNLLPGLLRAGQRFRVNVTPSHFYSEIPEFAHLKRETYWQTPWTMEGVRGVDVDVQLDRAARWCSAYGERLKANDIYPEACRRNGEIGFGQVEADFLYCFIRAVKPRRVVQVGCGVSTAIILRAVSEEPGYTPRVTCVEPYPTDFLREEAQRGGIHLLPEMAQRVALEEFTSLEAGDLLFVDSAHTVRPGSEVLRIIFEVLPRLRPGVFVHFHDIFFPHDFAPDLLDKAVFFGRESPFLHAFLCGNPSYEIAVSLSMLHQARADGLRRLMPNYRPRPMKGGLSAGEGHFPSSTYLHRVS